MRVRERERVIECWKCLLHTIFQFLFTFDLSLFSLFYLFSLDLEKDLLLFFLYSWCMYVCVYDDDHLHHNVIVVVEVIVAKIAIVIVFAVVNQTVKSARCFFVFYPKIFYFCCCGYRWYHIFYIQTCTKNHPFIIIISLFFNL